MGFMTDRLRSAASDRGEEISLLVVGWPACGWGCGGRPKRSKAGQGNLKHGTACKVTYMYGTRLGLKQPVNLTPHGTWAARVLKVANSHRRPRVGRWG